MFNAFLFRKTTKCQCNLCLRSIYKINLLIAFLFSIRGRDWRRLKPGQAILKTRNVPSVEDSQKFNTFHSEQWAKVHIWQRQRLCKKENFHFCFPSFFLRSEHFLFLVIWCHMSYDVWCRSQQKYANFFHWGCIPHLYFNSNGPTKKSCRWPKSFFQPCLGPDLTIGFTFLIHWLISMPKKFHHLANSFLQIAV